MSNLPQPKTYKDLLFWKTAFETSKLVILLSRKLHRNTENQILLNQLIRSSASVGANIAEGYGRFGTKEFSRFLRISLGSANETEYWLLLLKESNQEFAVEINLIITRNTESIKMLAKSLQSLKLRK